MSDQEPVHDDMMLAEDYSVEELREAVFEGRGRLSRPLALALLERKDYPQRVRDLERLLVDEGEAPRLRTMAAASLGRLSTAPAVGSLEKGLNAQDGVTLRGVVTALGHAGKAKHVAPLEELARRSDAVGKAAARARDALASRLRKEEATTRRIPPGMLRAEPREATPIEIKRPPKRDVDEVRDSIPGRRLSPEGAVRMQCQGRDLLFAFEERARREGLDALREPGELGVVAERARVEGTGWEERYRLVVQPVDEDEADIIVVAHSARPVLRGRAWIGEDEATYELSGIEAPGALAVEMRGRYDGRRVTVEEARSAVRRLPSPSPQPLQRP